MSGRIAVEIIKTVVNGKVYNAKKCTLCGKLKNLESGYYFNEYTNRHQSRCKKCVKEDGAKRASEKFSSLTQEEKNAVLTSVREKYNWKRKSHGGGKVDAKRMVHQ